MLDDLYSCLKIVDQSQSKDGGELLSEAMGIGIETEKLGRMMQHRVDGFRVKLNQWVKPSAIGEPYPPPLTHLGIHRINWASSALESDIETLKRHGVKFISPIAPCCEGDASTFGFIIFEDSFESVLDSPFIKLSTLYIMFP